MPSTMFHIRILLELLCYCTNTLRETLGILTIRKGGKREWMTPDPILPPLSPPPPPPTFGKLLHGGETGTSSLGSR